MNYEEFVNTKLPKRVKVEKVESTLNDRIEKIEEIIKKKMPQELKDFYSFCDGLSWHYEALRVEPFNGALPSDFQSLPSLEAMFDGFRIQPDLTIEGWDEEDEDEWIERTEYFHRNIYLEDLDSSNELIDISTEEGRNHFNILSNMKLLVSIEGHEGNIIIDFYCSHKPYQLYYQVYEELYALDLSLETFYTIFLQIGLANFWFTAFLSKEVQEATNLRYDQETLNFISHFYPEFDLKQLPEI